MRNVIQHCINSVVLHNNRDLYSKLPIEGKTGLLLITLTIYPFYPDVKQYVIAVSAYL